MVVEEPRWVAPYQPASIILRKDLRAIARISGGDLVELSSEPAVPELSARSLLETVATPAAEKEQKHKRSAPPSNAC